MPPNPNKPLILYLAVFENSMGYVLGQHDELGRKKRAIYYPSKKLTEFYVNYKAVKGSTVVDFLANRALEDYEPLNFDFPDEDLMYVAATENDSQKNHTWKLNFDGALNAIDNGIGTVLVSLNGDHYPFTSKLNFDYTNNMAEYEMTDVLATLASMIKVNKQEGMKPIQMRIYKAPAHFCNIDEEEEKDGHPWYHNILQYVRNREYPDQATENDKRTLRRLAIDYILDGDIL
ncbi:uncharacterized protein LOC108487716 [Gossypium arboreum]|uniref:uncharacterized protein LOC108487716 n=1 Tax=Gossypium arboreum TaxID=29729 RepID=UPI0008195BC8|nr:uncharacterized protein LOC108487716 [Gossypium arboreum]